MFSFTWATSWILALYICYVIILSFRKLVYWRKRGVPHGFDLPFIHGFGTILFGGKSFPDLIDSMYYRFPTTRYYGSFNTNRPTIILRDIELIREVCIKNFDSFTDHMKLVDFNTDPVFARNILMLKGERWKEMRRTLSPSFTAAKMKFMFHLVAECSQNFVNYYKENLQANAEINIKDAFTRYSNDVIATAAFGVSVNSLEYQENEFYLRGKAISDANKLLLMFKIITCMLCPPLARLMGITFLPAKTNQFFKTLIGDAVRTRDEQGIVRPDMIHLLMQARDADGIDITIEDIVAQAAIFFLGGFETTSTAMCYIAHELGYNPDIQEKLRNEVDECLSSNEEITYDTLNDMKYMDMVINETLRKYPPIPVMDRVCTAPCKLPPGLPGYSEYETEVGTTINIPVYSIHRDPTFFPDPDKFDPERFNDENKDRIDPCSYMPFGLGPRKCIASRFALMEIKILIARILKDFVIRSSNKTPYPVIFAANAFNMQPKDGFWNYFEERKKNN